MIRIYNGYSIDPNFETYYRDAVAAGLGVGVYYYSYATSVEAAQADANTVLGIKRQNTKLPGRNRYGGQCTACRPDKPESYGHCLGILQYDYCKRLSVRFICKHLLARPLL